MRAAVYSRISQDGLNDSLGVKRQERACVALCESLGWTVAEKYVDNDISAYSGRQRPGYDEMMAAVEAGDIQAIVVWHPDRLHRRPVELEAFIATVESHKVKVRTVETGEIDLATPSGRLTARVVGALARAESEHKSARLRLKATELAEAGKVSGGGARPFGFNADRVTHDRREARQVREAARRVLAGEAMRSVCADFDRRGVTTTMGKSWSPTVMRRMLLSGRIAGIRDHHGEESKAVWSPIITEAEHRHLVAMLTHPDRKKSRSARSYLLTGMTVCGRCGTNLVARPVVGGKRAMCCPNDPGRRGCGGIRVMAEPVEELVTEAVLQAIEESDLDRDGEESDDVGDESEPLYAALKERSAELARMFGAGEVTGSEWRIARDVIDVERRLLQEAERSQRPDAALRALLGGGDIRRAWARLPLDRRRAVVGAVVDVVVVNPAKRGGQFDPTRVDIRWLA